MKDALERGFSIGLLIKVNETHVIMRLEKLRALGWRIFVAGGESSQDNFLEMQVGYGGKVVFVDVGSQGFPQHIVEIKSIKDEALTKRTHKFDLLHEKSPLPRMSIFPS